MLGRDVSFFIFDYSGKSPFPNLTFLCHMKRIALICLLLAGWLMAAAQTYHSVSYEGVGQNPGRLNAEEETPYQPGSPDGWDLVLAGTGTQQWSSVQALPFNFIFDGQVFDEYKVSSTGVLTFSLGATDVPPVSNTTLPAASIPDNSVCIWGLYAPSDDEVITSKTFGTSPNRQHWISFRNYEYPESVAPVADVFWSIVLEETTGRVYLVDQRRPTFSAWNASLTLGIQIDATNALLLDGSPDIANLSTKSGQPSDNTYYGFYPGEQPANDAEVLAIAPQGGNLSLTEAPFQISARLFNAGSEELQTLRLHYSIDGQAAPVYHLYNVASGDTLEHRIPWTPAEAGTYELRVWVDLPNGRTDPSASNNEMTTALEVLADPTDRLSLIESFTAHDCPPCATGNPILDAVVDANYPAVAHLKFITQFLGSTDPRRLFNPTDNATRVNYYNVTAIPTAYVNGTTSKNSAAISNVDVTNGDELPGEVAIDIEEGINGNSIDVAVDFFPINDQYAGQPIVAHVGLVQNELYYPAPTGTNGEQDYFYTMRYMIPNANGTTLPYNGDTLTVSGSRAISPIFNGSLMHVVAYVQNRATREILMATKSPGIYFCDDGSTITVDDLIVEKPNCATANNGRIELQLSGGTAPYTVAWSGSSETGLVAENLTPGNYTATITDQSGCSFELPTRVQIGNRLTMELEAEEISCTGADDATLKAVIRTGDYTYAWASGETTSELSGLAAGTYALTVTDEGGCSVTDEFTIPEPVALQAQTQQTLPDANSNGDGEATVEVIGGAAPYTYSWNTSPPQTTATATNLSLGTYEVVVTDAKGCTTTETVEILATDLERTAANIGLDHWRIAPNPVQGQLAIELTLAQPQAFTLRLYDQQGRLVRQEAVSATQRYQQRWDLSDLVPGYYALQVQTSQGQAQRRLIVR